MPAKCRFECVRQIALFARLVIEPPCVVIREIESGQLGGVGT